MSWTTTCDRSAINTWVIRNKCARASRPSLIRAKPPKRDSLSLIEVPRRKGEPCESRHRRHQIRRRHVWMKTASLLGQVGTGGGFEVVNHKRVWVVDPENHPGAARPREVFVFS